MCNLLLTVSYGPSFFQSPSVSGPSAKLVRAINRRGKKRSGSITYSTDRKDEVSKTFILSVLGPGTISIHENRLQIFGTRRKQNEAN